MKENPKNECYFQIIHFTIDRKHTKSINSVERQILYDLTYTWILKKVDLIGTESRMGLGVERCWIKGTNFQL